MPEILLDETGDSGEDIVVAHRVPSRPVNDVPNLVRQHLPKPQHVLVLPCEHQLDIPLAVGS